MFSYKDNTLDLAAYTDEGIKDNAIKLKDKIDFIVIFSCLSPLVLFVDSYLVIKK